MTASPIETYAAEDPTSSTQPSTGSEEPPVLGTDSGRKTPPVLAGRTDEAVISVCEAFVIGYGEFSPFDFEPAQDWQSRWTKYATPTLVGRAQRGLTQQWAWTWQTARKAFDVRITKPGIVIDRDGDTRTVVVDADRLILGINDTGDKAITQNLTFACQMKIGGDNDFAQVDDVAQTPPGAPRGR